MFRFRLFFECPEFVRSEVPEESSRSRNQIANKPNGSREAIRLRGQMMSYQERHSSHYHLIEEESNDIDGKKLDVHLFASFGTETFESPLTVPDEAICDGDDEGDDIRNDQSEVNYVVEYVADSEIDGSAADADQNEFDGLHNMGILCETIFRKQV